MGLCVAAAGLLGFAEAASALSPDRPLGSCSVKRWQVRDGLPGDSIRALTQDRQGALWIAAWGGIARYDGTGLVRIEAPPELRPAAGDVTKVLALQGGVVWAGSANHPPLAVLGDSARALPPQSGLPPAAGTLAWVEGPGGLVYLASAGGLFRHADGRFAQQPLQGLDGRRLGALAIDGRGRLWLGTDRGLYSLVGSDVVPHQTLPQAAVSALFVDRRQVLWVAAGGALFALDGERVTRIGTPEGLPPAEVVDLDDDEDGHLWAATSRGLVRVRAEKATVFTTSDGLPENDVTAVLVDQEGSLWVGTRNGGLAQFSDRTLDTQAVPAELHGQELSVLAEDAAQGLWFGTMGHGVLRWKDGHGERYRLPQGLPDDRVTALVPHPDGAMWIGTEAGLCRWRQGAIEHPGIWQRPVSALFRDDRGQLWIGGHGELGRWDPGTGGSVQRFGLEQGVPARRVRSLAQDRTGHLWISGIGRPPLGRLETGRFTRPPAFRDRRIGPVRAMLLDRGGTFWLTITSVGLVALSHDRTWIFDGRHGFDVNGLYQMIEDDAGDLWIGTSRSILRVSRASLAATAEGWRPAPEVVSFESTDRGAGVVASELKQRAVLKDHRGRVWFVTAQGAVAIDPGGVRSNPVPARVRIESVTVDGRPMSLTPSTWPTRFGRLEVHYAATALLEPGKVRYRHRLEGLDGSWMAAGTRRVASYADLSPGPYRFRIMASNNDGRWQEGASLAFVVGAPFYRRPWFFVACGLGLLPLGFAIHRERMARLRARYTGIAAERTRVARELHDTLLQGMSGIAMQLEALVTAVPPDPPGPRRELEVLRREVRACLDQTRQVVWNLRDSEIGHGDLGPTLTRFARRLTRSSFTDCVVRIEGAPRHVPETLENHVFRVAQEALVNAAKHAEARRIEVLLRYTPDRLWLEVHDDGKGFAPDEASPPQGGHFGLLGMRERSADLGAHLTVRSQPGQGTHIILSVPLAHA